MATFKKPGTLPKPGVIGRMLRLMFAFILLYFFISVITGYRFGGVIEIKDIGLWIGLAYCFYALPHAINIGLGLHLGRWPQLIFVVIVLLSIIWDLTLSGIFPGKALSLSVVALILYVTCHIGLSHFIASILAVPG